MEGESKGWAVILGASSGFGAAVATACAEEGLDVCGVHLDRRATLPQAESVRAAIERCGRQALFFNVNAADPDKRREVLDSLSGQAPAGSVRLLFHSLAFGSLVPLVGEDARCSARPSQVAMTLDVMASSLVYWTQELVWRGLLGRGGRILAMTSSGASRAMANYGIVSAAKAALEAYVRQLALELGPRGITANALRAGVTDTPALRKIPGWQALKERAASVNPGGRTTIPSDVANAVRLLLRPQADWISGNVIGVDGGEDIVG
ncbi:MAG: SDR family oxidoreductase [Candidatus Dadabacteria bacterium]|nr:MAG: SDR family oxidoreductase [Candidatus Dadabacteria bacterium]